MADREVMKDVPMGEIKLNPGNPRVNEEAVAQVVLSMEKSDYISPIIVDETNTILAGNTRYKALIKMGKDKVPLVIKMLGLTKEQKERFILADNKTQEFAEWDWAKLNVFTKDMLEDVGFTKDEMDKIFMATMTDPDEVPELRKTTDIKPGDMFQLGPHSLICGDSTKPDFIAKVMQGRAAKLCFTSPPYNMGADLYDSYTDDLKSLEFVNMHMDVMRNVKAHLKGFLFWNVSYNKNARWEFLEILYMIAKEPGMTFLELIVWDKGHGMPISSKESLTRRYEEILLVGTEDDVQKDLDLFALGTTDKKAYFNKKSQRGITNYWRVDTGGSQTDDLKACFPVALPTKAIALMTMPGEIVVDPFCGSGSTIIAAHQMNRVGVGIEMNPIYCERICERWEQFTGGKRVKL